MDSVSTTNRSNPITFVGLKMSVGQWHWSEFLTLICQARVTQNFAGFKITVGKFHKPT